MPPQLTTLNGAARLTDWGVIRAVGADAAAFLHGQLTQNVQAMQPGQSRLAAWCNPKGRMLASFWVYRRAADDVLLLCSSDLLARTLKRLSMFVLRAKVALTDVSADFDLYGLLGEAAHAPRADADGVTIALPQADGAARALRLAPPGAPAPNAPALAADIWPWAAVRSGVALLTAPVAEAFVPQMLNYESVDGVDFKKGCYPGQEVVARSQFRGAIKRRAWVARVNAAAQAGQEIFYSGGDDPAQPAASPDPSESVGLIAQAAPEPGASDGGTALIACLPVAAVQAAATGQGRFTLGVPGGPALTDLHRPYPLREDI
jgi:folate-binding protein YgfZ